MNICVGEGLLELHGKMEKNIVLMWKIFEILVYERSDFQFSIAAKYILTPFSVNVLKYPHI